MRRRVAPIELWTDRAPDKTIRQKDRGAVFLPATQLAERSCKAGRITWPGVQLSVMFQAPPRSELRPTSIRWLALKDQFRQREAAAYLEIPGNFQCCLKSDLVGLAVDDGTGETKPGLSEGRALGWNELLQRYPVLSDLKVNILP